MTNSNDKSGSPLQPTKKRSDIDSPSLLAKLTALNQRLERLLEKYDRYHHDLLILLKADDDDPAYQALLERLKAFEES